MQGRRGERARHSCRGIVNMLSGSHRSHHMVGNGQVALCKSTPYTANTTCWQWRDHWWVRAMVLTLHTLCTGPSGLLAIHCWLNACVPLFPVTIDKICFGALAKHMALIMSQSWSMLWLHSVFETSWLSMLLCDIFLRSYYRKTSNVQQVCVCIHYL